MESCYDNQGGSEGAMFNKKPKGSRVLMNKELQFASQIASPPDCACHHKRKTISSGH
jgi:hypothetical protein